MEQKKNTLFSGTDICHAVSLSGGKDSTAMLLLMLDQDMPIDIVLFADTGMEFPEMYEHLSKVDRYLYERRKIHITTLRHPYGFEWLMFEEPKKKPSVIERRQRNGVPIYGNGWPGIHVRWCTGQLKTHLITKKVNEIKGKCQAYHYVGIAYDERERCKSARYPLVDWEITEAQALKICYEHGFDFGGLYKLYHRASCWCCPFQQIGELRKLRKHHTELWEHLQIMDKRAREQFGTGPLGQFKKNWSVERLEERFLKEEKSNAPVTG
jgi:3'-phosphoadenosine 5'-phosphosulfate sulfotransferase (PAPS reductase)/FAD synthetase